MSFSREKNGEVMQPTPVKDSPVEEVGRDASVGKTSLTGFDRLQAQQAKHCCQYPSHTITLIVAPAAPTRPATGEVRYEQR